MTDKILNICVGCNWRNDVKGLLCYDCLSGELIQAYKEIEKLKESINNKDTDIKMLEQEIDKLGRKPNKWENGTDDFRNLIIYGVN